MSRAVALAALLESTLARRSLCASTSRSCRFRIAATDDWARSRQPGGDLSGYRSGVDWVTFSRSTLIAVGPNGSDVSYDGARSWTAFDTASYDAVDCVPFTCWASGTNGAAAVLERR